MTYDPDAKGSDWNLTYGQERDLLDLLGQEGYGTPGDMETTLYHLFGSFEPLNEWLADVQANPAEPNVRRLAEFDAILRRGQYSGQPVPYGEFVAFLTSIREAGVYGTRTDYGGSDGE